MSSNSKSKSFKTYLPNTGYKNGSFYMKLNKPPILQIYREKKIMKDHSIDNFIDPIHKCKIPSSKYEGIFSIEQKETEKGIPIEVWVSNLPYLDSSDKSKIIQIIEQDILIGRNIIDFFRKEYENYEKEENNHVEQYSMNSYEYNYYDKPCSPSYAMDGYEAFERDF